MKMLSVTPLIVAIGLLSSGIAHADYRYRGDYDNCRQSVRHPMPYPHIHRHRYENQYRHHAHRRHPDHYRHREHRRHHARHEHHRPYYRRVIRGISFANGLLREQAPPRRRVPRHEYREDVQQPIISSRSYR